VLVLKKQLFADETDFSLLFTQLKSFRFETVLFLDGDFKPSEAHVASAEDLHLLNTG
jgi:hypothetical protein